MYLTEREIDKFCDIYSDLTSEVMQTSGVCPFSDSDDHYYDALTRCEKGCASLVPDLIDAKGLVFLCPCDTARRFRYRPSSGLTKAQLVRIVAMVLRQNGVEV